MTTKAEKAALKAYPEQKEWSPYGPIPVDTNLESRWKFQEGYEQAENDILSKITTEHLEGLKWIEKAGITSQPHPYHKYCKDLRITLEKLLNDE